MRIGVDARSLDGKLTGIGRYIFEILHCMPQQLPDAEWVLYSRRPLEVSLPSGRWLLKSDPYAMGRRIPSSLWVKARLGSLIRHDSLDVFWAASTLAPHARVPYVSTVYDLNHQIVPETMTPVNRFAHMRWLARDVMRANQVVSISSGTAMRLEKAIGRASDGIARPGSQWARMGTPEGSAPVNEPYVLSVATREPRKNLANLIEAFGMLKAQGKLPRQVLVLAGAAGWGVDSNTQAPRPEWLRELGYVPDERMSALFAHADVLAQPSIYEGFGMPAAEAAALGTRVVATDIPELREAAGPSGVFVGTSASEIAEGLLKALDMAPPPPHQATSWNDAAAVTARALQCAAASRRQK